MHWPTKSIEEIASPKKSALATGPFGSSIGSKTFREKGVPVIRGGNLSADIDQRLCDDDLVFIDDDLASQFSRSEVLPGDLVFTCWGTINQVGIVDKRSRYNRYIVSNKQMKLTPDPEQVAPLFLSYYFSSPLGQRQIELNAIGSSVPGFNLTKLRQLQVPVPELEVQHAIAETVSAFDDKIDLNRRMNETLEAMAQAVFRDWFVDFGPTRRKMEGATDPVTVLGELTPNPEKAATLAPLFPTILADNGLPEGWEASTLAAVSELNPESWSAREHPDQIEYVDLTNTKWGVIEETSTYEWSAAPSRARRVVRVGDTVVGTVRPGNGSYSYIGRDGLTASTGFAVLRPKRQAWRPVVYCAATRSENITHLASLADGGAYPAVRPDVVLQSPFNMPGEELLAQFGERLSPSFALIEHNKAENSTLAAIRDLLLPKLMSGEIRLQDVEAAI